MAPVASMASMAPMPPGHSSGAMPPVAPVTAVALVAFGRGCLGSDHSGGEQHRGHDERRRQSNPFHHLVELLPSCDPFADPLPVGNHAARASASNGLSAT
jgi:hypothetical protein